MIHSLEYDFIAFYVSIIECILRYLAGQELAVI